MHGFLNVKKCTGRNLNTVKLNPSFRIKTLTANVENFNESIGCNAHL